MRHFVSLGVSLLVIGLAASAETFGQDSPRGDGQRGMRGGPGMMGGPPGMMGGPPPGMMGGPPGMMGGGPGGTSDRLVQVLRTMDANGDGVLTLNEIPEQRRPFAMMMLQRMGRDPNQPVNLNSLAAAGSPAGGSAPAAASGASMFGGGRNRTAAPSALVQPFGEKTPAATVTPFGQAVPTATVTAGGGSRQAASTLSPVEKNARELMEKYDRNRNGFLDKDKQEWNRVLPFDANRSDKNRDGRLSMAEIIAALGGTTTAASGAMIAPFRPSEPYDHLPVGVPPWFIQRDKDRDCQLTMVEYADGQPWTQGVVAEFEFLDLNGDGVATVTECFAVLQRIDQEKAQKADAEQRAREKLQGGVAALPPPPDPAATPTPPAEGVAAPAVPPNPNDPNASAASPPVPPGVQPPTATNTLPPTPPQPSAAAPYADGSQPSASQRPDSSSRGNGRGSYRGDRSNGETRQPRPR
ncbi:MAG: hypothetical protein ACRC46_06180 [Thermoguttaceae bacterium]